MPTTITETRVEDGIVKRLSADGSPLRKPYCVRYRVGGQSRRKAFATLKEARRFLADTKTSVLTGHFVDPVKREVTFSAWLDDDYLPSMLGVWAEGHGKSQVQMIDRHVRPTFGAMPIASIRSIDVQKWINTLVAKGYKPNTIERYYNALNAVLNAAKHNGILVKSPCSKIARPEVTKAVENVLSPADVVKIAGVVDPRFELAVWLGAMTGMRLGEMLGLTLDRIDFTEQTIKVDRQWTRRGRFGPTKTRKSRTIPVNADLLARIEAHVAVYGTTRSGTLFGRTDAPIAASNFYSAVWAPVKKLGFPEDCDSPHALRHHYASVLIDDGRSPTEVQERLGHATPSQTMDTYTHLFPKSEDRTRNAFDGLYTPVLRAVS